MRELVCYDKEDGMPRVYMMTEDGRVFLCDQGEAIEEVENTKNLVFLGARQLSIRHVAECLGVLTDNVYDNHQRAMDAAVKRLKKWACFYPDEEIRLCVTIKRDEKFLRLQINDLDTGTRYVDSGNFDDSDYASRWARRFINALKDLYGENSVLKVKWDIKED